MFQHFSLSIVCGPVVGVGVVVVVVVRRRFVEIAARIVSVTVDIAL